MGWFSRKRSAPPIPDKPKPTPHGTYLIRANLQCCEACPNKLKNKLQKIKGVNAVNIDVSKGLVSVTGVVNASVLMYAVWEVKTSAKLVSFNEEKDQKKAEEKKKEEEAKSKIMKEKRDECSYKKEGTENKESGDKKPPEGGCQGNFAFMGSSCPGGPVQHCMLYPPPGQYGCPPMPPHYVGGPPPMAPHYGGGQQPMPGFLPPPLPMQSQPPQIKVNPPPPSYPDDYYKRKPDLTAGNTIFHQFRDDNVDSCSIM